MTLLRQHKTDVLIFVEDPSVANYVASLPQELARKGLQADIYASEIAIDYLRQRNVTFQELPFDRTVGYILESIKPRSLVVGTAENPDTMGLPFIKEARRRGIPTIGLVDAFMNADKRFRGRTDDPLAFAPDWVLVPDNSTRQIFNALGIPEEQVVVCGHPQYDHVIRLAEQWQQDDFTAFRQRVLPRAQEGRPIVVFAGEGSARNKPLDERVLDRYTLKGRGCVKGRTEIALEEFLEAAGALSPRPYIVLRVHPKDAASDFAVYSPELDLISQGGSPLELIYAADLVVGMTSMLLTEAVLTGRKTLSIIPDIAEKEWLPSIRNGATPCVTTREELRGVLQKLLLKAGNAPVQSSTHHGFVLGAIQRIITLIEHVLSGNCILSREYNHG